MTTTPITDGLIEILREAAAIIGGTKEKRFPIVDELEGFAGMLAHPTPCVICGADEPRTGTCGSNDPRALCNAAPAHGSIAGDTQFNYLLEQYGISMWNTMDSDPRDEAKADLVAHIDAHIAQRAASDEGTPVLPVHERDQRAASGDAEVVLQSEEQFKHALQICNAMADTVGDDAAHPLFPMMHALMNIIGAWEDRATAAPAPIADEVAFDWTRDGMEAFPDGAWVPRPPAPKASAPATDHLNDAINMVSAPATDHLNDAINMVSAPDASAGELPPLPPLRQTVGMQGYDEKDMRAYVLADRAARAAAAPAGAAADLMSVAEACVAQRCTIAMEDWLEARQGAPAPAENASTMTMAEWMDQAQQTCGDEPARYRYRNNPADLAGGYELVGTADGAGTSRGKQVTVYRHSKTGTLFFRLPGDFDARMELVTAGGVA